MKILQAFEKESACEKQPSLPGPTQTTSGDPIRASLLRADRPQGSMSMHTKPRTRQSSGLRNPLILRVSAAVGDLFKPCASVSAFLLLHLLVTSNGVLVAKVGLAAAPSQQEETAWSASTARGF